MAQKRSQANTPESSDSETDDNGSVEEATEHAIELHCQEIDRPLAGHVRRHRISLTDPSTTTCRNVHRFITASRPLLNDLLNGMLDELRAFKFQIRLRIDFHKAAHPETTADAYFAHRQSLLLTQDDTTRIINDSLGELVANLESFEQRGSGWVVKSVSYMDIHVARYQPLLASSYIPVPKCLSKSRAIVNPQNYDDEKCFMYCILAAKNPNVRNPHRVSTWRHGFETVQTSCLTFPVTLAQIPIFERANNLSINVYGFDNADNQLYPLYVSQSDVEVDDYNFEQHINLLLLSRERKQHYCLISDLNRLLHSQTKGRYRKHFCRRCLSCFKSETSLQSHFDYCRTQRIVQRIKMPKMTSIGETGNGEDDATLPPILQFKQHKKALRQCLILYGDFECLTEKLESEEPSIASSYTRKMERHIPCGFAIQPIFQCCSNTSSVIEQPRVYRGRDAVAQFLETCIDRAEDYQTLCDRRNRKLKMTGDEWKRFHAANLCQMCGETFKLCQVCSTNSPVMNRCIQCQLEKCRDHCHFCSKYRAAVHNKCNLKNQIDRDVLVAMHNSRRYDTHLVMQKLGIVANTRGFTLDVIAKSSEDYISFSLIMKHNHPTLKQKHSGGKPFVFTWRLRFLDTYQFLSSSLDSLVKNLLTKGTQHFASLNKRFPDNELNTLLLRKGIYPYRYMDKWERFEETKLPPIEAFYNDLTLSPLSEGDYSHGIKVFEMFKLNNLGEYHDLYVLTDTLLLADVFESFRLFGLDHYGLDPAHYFTLPSFGWSALLKLSKVQLELLTDSEMYRFIESGIRGGISVITHRFARANNPYLPNYDPSLPRSYIFYIDANNLYGWTMVYPLPTRSFQWLTEEEIQTFDINSMSSIPDRGYILEVDLDYPEKLHNSHNCYPLAPEKRMITCEMLSPYCHRLNGNASKTPKLLQTLTSKRNYIVHYENLLLYLKLGLKLTRIHRILQFEQSAWMKEYIEFNTEMRKKARSNFDKDLFKLLNNSVFGKSMENVRDYVDLKLVSDEGKYLQLVADPRFEESVVFDDTLVAVKMKKVTVTLNKPIYVGFTVLERSKNLMFSFHYDHIVAEYGSCAKLLFSDTDSLCYLIKTEDVYDDVAKHSELYDTSDYPVEHKLHNDSNKKVMGKMKDETNSIPIEEFVGLRPKMYSIKFGGVEKKTAKGVSKAVVKKRLRHQDYVNILESASTMRHSMTILRNELHKMYTIELKKVSLSAYDDKRFLAENGIDSFAYGHYKIYSISEN